MDEWFDVIELPITIEQFRALPTNPAYKYEYFDGRAYLSPRPKGYTAWLPLAPRPTVEVLEIRRQERVTFRPLRNSDWDALPKLFSAAFHRVQPYCRLDDARRLEAASLCLEKTRTGGDGPIVPEACVVMASEADGRPLAAMLVTVQGGYDADEFEVDALGGELPHLTWIFVPPLLARHGIGSAMLGVAVNALLGLGHSTLASTFLLGNESSTLWHWSNGFRLASYMGSPRRWQRMSRRAAEGLGSS